MGYSTMNDEQGFTVLEVDWNQYKDELRKIRDEVFIKEQHVPKEIEWDGLDESAIHVIAQTDGKEFIGTARLIRTGQIGRMAVISKYRGQGVGSLMLKRLIAIAKDKGLNSIFLHAQTHAIEFYLSQGFKEDGEIFMDADIPHKMMIYR